MIRRTMMVLTLIAGAALLFSGQAFAEITLRFGHFPNITHIQGLVAHALSRQGKGFFEQRLGPDAKIEWFLYNAGPGAMEAIFAKSIDVTYVGPNPVINAYTKARGEGVRIIAGAAEGGSALVIQGDSALASPADFRGKVIATPQLGNTQDVVAAQRWAEDHADRRRSHGAANCKPRSAAPVQAAADRCGLDRRALDFKARA
jgi:sulfonate transport system substrate-binding protein